MTTTPLVEQLAARIADFIRDGQLAAGERLVERRIAERGASIRLNRGRYPYPDYEPLAFWGVPTFPPGA